MVQHKCLECLSYHDRSCVYDPYALRVQVNITLVKVTFILTTKHVYCISKSEQKWAANSTLLHPQKRLYKKWEHIIGLVAH